MKSVNYLIILLVTLSFKVLASSEARAVGVCNNGIYASLSKSLKSYAPAQAFCSTAYPVRCPGQRKRSPEIDRRTLSASTSTATSSTTTVSSNSGPSTTSRSIVPVSGQAAFSQLQKQGNAAISTLCSCILPPKVSQTWVAMDVLTEEICSTTTSAISISSSTTAPTTTTSGCSPSGTLTASNGCKVTARCGSGYNAGLDISVVGDGFTLQQCIDAFAADANANTYSFGGDTDRCLVSGRSDPNSFTDNASYTSGQRIANSCPAIALNGCRYSQLKDQLISVNGTPGTPVAASSLQDCVNKASAAGSNVYIYADADKSCTLSGYAVQSTISLPGLGVTSGAAIENSCTQFTRKTCSVSNPQSGINQGTCKDGCRCRNTPDGQFCGRSSGTVFGDCTKNADCGPNSICTASQAGRCLTATEC